MEGQQASCPFVQCWLQEFLDPLPKLCAGCPLKVPGEGFGSSGRVRLQLLEVFIGMQSPLWMGKMLPQTPTPHCMTAAQPNLLSCKSRSCTPGQQGAEQSQVLWSCKNRNAPRTQGLGKRKEYSLLKCTGLLEGQAEPPGRGSRCGN